MKQVIQGLLAAIFRVGMPVALLVGVAPCSAVVISGPVAFGGHTYSLLSDNTWTASQAEAVTLGGNLVTIDSLAENNFLVSQFGNFGGVQANLWIGLNDIATEGTFNWVSGAPVTFTNWAGGEPNAAFPDEDYVMINSAIFGSQWNDSRNLVFPFGTGFPPARGIVEVVPAVVPEPATLALLSLGLAGLGFSRRRKLN